MDKYALKPEGNLFRIIALRDFGNVKAGDIGGIVSSQHNLSQLGNCWVNQGASALDDSRVYDNAILSFSARLTGRATVLENALISKNASMCGLSRASGMAVVTGNATMHDSAFIGGAAVLNEHARASDNAHITGSAHVRGSARLSGHISISQEASILKTSHTLQFGPVGCRDEMGSFFRNSDGRGLLAIGENYWTIGDFKKMIMGDKWPHENVPQRSLLRGEMLEIFDLCNRREERWVHDRY